MSRENVVKFIKSAESNPELKAKLSEIRRAAIQSIARETASLAAEHGLPFSAEDFVELQTEAGELSEKELDAVAGGDLGYGGHLLRNWS